MHHADFVHLHVHTYFSLLEGACPISQLADQLHDLKMPAAAITDYGNLYGAVEFYETLSAKGVKPILGGVVYLLTEGLINSQNLQSEGFLSQLTLLARNQVGYRNLCKLLSIGHLEGFYYKPRIDKEILRKYSEGIIALSGTGRGEIPIYLQRGDIKRAKEASRWYQSIFGEDNFYLELSDQGLPEQKKIREGIISLSKQEGLPLVATNDVHYLTPSDADSQDAIACIQMNKLLDDANRPKKPGDQFYLKSPEQMKELFKDYPEAISNTIKIAERCNVEFDFKTYHFPHFEPPKGKDLKSWLEELSKKGLEERFRKIKNANQSEYRERLQEELGIINSMGFPGYFLIVADFISYAKTNQVPVGPGRGSAAGSLVAYALKITDVDPIQNDLLFERFLNPERISMPDMDIDFCMRKRDKVLEYVTKKYVNVSQIITFGRMKAKAVVRDVGRVLGMPYADVDRIAKLIPNALNITLKEALEIEPQIKALAKKDETVDRLLSIAKKLEGFPRHASTHAAGVVIANQPLENFTPLARGTNGEAITQYEMKAVEKIGLVKFDFLGLKTLTVIQDAIDLIKARHSVTIDLESLPLDDEAVYQQLSSGDSAAVFQLESQGMTDLVVKLKPNCFEDLTALVALFRPGPLGSGMVDDFINRKHGRKQIRYDLPEMEPILKTTYGIILYQEQVMKIASTLANFSLGDADLLRRAMGKKKPEVMAEQKEKFLLGSKENKIAPHKAEKIFDLMAKFAEYGFNKSHSAAYALVSYQTAYLKTHYPTEYMASVLNTEKGNTDKILGYINDCKSCGIEVTPPTVQLSFSDFTVLEEKKISYGLSAVKNVGSNAAQAIVEARNDGAPFTTFFEFCERVDLRRSNRRALESLIKCGGFDSFGFARSQFFAALDNAMEAGAAQQRVRSTGQTGLFDKVSFQEKTSENLPEIEEWPERQKLSYEKEALGFYMTGHPLYQVEELLKQYSTIDSEKIHDERKGKSVRVGGMVAALREITTKKGDRMGFVTLEDLNGVIEVVVFPELYKKSVDLLKSDHTLLIIGNIDEGEESNKLIGEEVILLEEAVQHLTKSIHFKLAAPEMDSKHLSTLKNILSRFKGECPAFLHLKTSEETETILELPPELKVAPSSQLVESVEKVFGHNVTWFQTESN